MKAHNPNDAVRTIFRWRGLTRVVEKWKKWRHGRDLGQSQVTDSSVLAGGCARLTLCPEATEENSNETEMCRRTRSSRLRIREGACY
jgi:hypothetical protein